MSQRAAKGLVPHYICVWVVDWEPVREGIAIMYIVGTRRGDECVCCAVIRRGCAPALEAFGLITETQSEQRKGLFGGSILNES